MSYSLAACKILTAASFTSLRVTAVRCIVNNAERRILLWLYHFADYCAGDDTVQQIAFPNEDTIVQMATLLAANNMNIFSPSLGVLV